MKTLCIYCGSSSGGRPEYAAAALAAGQALVRRGIGLVYGGGNVGMMGRIADAVIDAGGEVIGVIPHHLADKELAHERATQMIRVDSMHERKQRMADLSDGFVALPGGIGTLEEPVRDADLAAARPAPKAHRPIKRGGLLRQDAGLP